MPIPGFLTFDRLLQTETISAASLGTAIAIGKRKKIAVAVDGAARVAFGYSNAVTAGPLVDSYSESNQDATVTLNGGGIVGVGQSFTSNAAPGNVLLNAQFYMQKTNLPTGNAVAKVYAVAGTDGTDAIPTGAALATSGNLDVSTLTGSLVLKTFTFTGANQIELRRGIVYFVTVEYSGGNGTDNIQVGYDNSTPTHAGNYADLTGSTWTAAAKDVCFYVNVTPLDWPLPGAGIYTVRNGSYTHLVIYNPDAAASLIVSVFEVFN